MAGIQGTGGLANEAFRAALRAQQDMAKNMTASMPNMPAAPSAPGNGIAGIGSAQGVNGAAPVSFADNLKVGLREVADQVQAAEQLPEQMVTGDVGEFHEIALKLKQSDLSFRFALQVRNKLIDAYREVMRMSV